MKRILPIIILIVLSMATQAQHRTSGQWILKADGGVVLLNDLGIGGTGAIGFEKVFKNGDHSLQFDVGLRTQPGQFKNLTTSNIYTYEGTLYYTYTFLRKNFFLMNIMPGGFCGYEQFTHNGSDIIMLKEGGLSVGVALATQLQFLVSHRIALYIEPSARYNLKSNEDFRILTKIGIKYNF